MQRITNVQYPQGAIIRGRLPREYCGYSYEYLNGRPLIVISQQSQMFDNLIVIPCGSRNRPGIEISIWDYKHERYVAEHEKSLAYPYNITQIRTNFIEEVLGFVDIFTMKEILRCVQYHLGMSDYVPPYMEQIHEALFAPRYSIGTEENTQLSDPHPMIGRHHAMRQGIPWTNGGLDTGVHYDEKDDFVGDMDLGPTTEADDFEEPKESNGDTTDESQTTTVLMAPAGISRPSEGSTTADVPLKPSTTDIAKPVRIDFTPIIKEFVSKHCVLKNRATVQSRVWYQALLRYCQMNHDIGKSIAMISPKTAQHLLHKAYPSISEKKNKSGAMLNNIDLLPDAVPIIVTPPKEPKKVVLKPPAQKNDAVDPTARVNPKTKEVVNIVSTSDDGSLTLYRPYETEEKYGDVEEPKSKAKPSKPNENSRAGRSSNFFEEEIAALSENEKIAFILGDINEQLEDKIPPGRSSRQRMKRALIDTISNGDIVRLCNNKLQGRDQNWRFLSEPEKIVLILYGDLKAVNITKLYIAARIRELGRKYGIHIQQKKYITIPNYQTLRELIP